MIGNTRFKNILKSLCVGNVIGDIGFKKILKPLALSRVQIQAEAGELTNERTLLRRKVTSRVSLNARYIWSIFSYNFLSR